MNNFVKSLMAAAGMVVILSGHQISIAGEDEPPFAFIEIEGNTLVTSHGLKVKITGDEGFVLKPPLNRSAVFNDNPFDISLTAYIGQDAAVMVHAESVSDNSGAANYSHLPASTWPLAGYHQVQACIELPAGEVEEEHDLSWLKSNGFTAVGPINYGQYYLTSTDHNHEVIITLLQKTNACREGSEDQADFLQSLKTKIRVELLGEN